MTLHFRLEVNQDSHQAIKPPKMSQNNQIKPEFLSDPAPLSPDEQSYLRTLLSEEDLEKCYEGHCEAAHRKLWNYFQVIHSFC